MAFALLYRFYNASTGRCDPGQTKLSQETGLSMRQAAVAGVVGSFAYNMTMTLGAGAVVRPLAIDNAALLHGPLLIMLGALAMPIALALPSGSLGRLSGLGLLLPM